MLFDVPFHAVGEQHVLSLITSESEGRQLEFKLRLPTDSHEDVVEFLKDVTAMANTIGGDILYGIAEGQDAGGNTLAVAVDGISGEDSDKVIQRLENIIRDNTDRRLIGHQIKAIEIKSNGNQVFLVRVPRSWDAPHAVTHRKHWRFYYRNSAGCHAMDVTELRHAVSLANSLLQRLQEFRMERVAKIASDISGKNGKVVLHIQPFSSTDPGVKIPFARSRTLPLDFISEEYGAVSQRINYEGLLRSVPEDKSGTYVQIFRTGKIEAVSSRLVADNVIVIKRFEGRLIKATQNYLTLLKELGVTAPLMLHITLLGVRGATLRTDVHAANARAELSPIEVDDLLLPGQLIQNFEDRPEEILHSSFDIVWNAGGFERSLNYDEDGNYSPQAEG